MQYHYSHSEPTWPCHYVWEPVQRIIRSRDWPDARCFDLGCGNGFLAARMSQLGFLVSGVDPSASGIEQAKKSFPHLTLRVAGTDEDLARTFGTLPLVYSFEVVEHVFEPMLYAKRFYDLLERGGLGIISTPYHGWLKNVAIAVSGQWDAHHTGLWEGGHIKFFSADTLTSLLTEAGFKDISIYRVRRIPPLAKSITRNVFKVGNLVTCSQKLGAP